MTNSSDPATTKGTTTAAGEGKSDDEFAKGVASETDPNLEAEDVFERESQGTSTDADAAGATADEVR